MEEKIRQRFTEKEYKKFQTVKNAGAIGFITSMIEHCNPKTVFINTFSKEDIEYIRQNSLKIGEELQLAKNGQTIHFDNYYDQARDKKNSRILIEKNHELKGVDTLDRETGLADVVGLFKNVMAGREMIIGFYSLGPSGSVFTMPCIQITDSYYVAHSENLLYRSGYNDFTSGKDFKYFFKFLHSSGEVDERKTSKNLDKRRVYIDLKDDMVYSINTQYAGNTVGLKKLSMRLAINHGSSEGWLCEHMLLMGIKGKNGRTTYISGAFPSLCGKTSTAMMEGETIVGDDIAYLRNVDGKARGVNTEKGIFGIIQGINSKDDPLIWKVINSGMEIIFSNILMTNDKNVFWKGRDGETPKEGLNHSGRWQAGSKDREGKEIPVSHPNARFTVALAGLDNLDPQCDSKDGVEVSACVYGGRDSDTSCPVGEAFDWGHGIVTKGAGLESETTAATLGKEGVREINPMSNIDFVSVPLGRYINMNLAFGKKLKKAPLIFGVNYFLRDKQGNFLNTRDDKRAWYKWIEKRINNEVGALKTPVELIPIYEDLREIFKTVLNKDFSHETYTTLFTLRVNENLKKIERVTNFYKNCDEVPETLFQVLQAQKERLEKARAKHGADYITPDAWERA